MNAPTVPPEMRGCWLRTWIRFTDGSIDDSTFVVWLQTDSDMADIRIAAERPVITASCLAECTDAELRALAESESSSGYTTGTAVEIDADGVRRSTAEWHTRGIGVNFQPITSYPEPGLMWWNEEGDVMWEAAPSGAYTEEWRLVPGSREGLTHVVRPDASHLYTAGRIAISVRDRSVEPHRPARLPDLISELGDDRAAVSALIDCEFSYAARNDLGELRVTHSTLPWREGALLDVVA